MAAVDDPDPITHIIAIGVCGAAAINFQAAGEGLPAVIALLFAAIAVGSLVSTSFRTAIQTHRRLSLAAFLLLMVVFALALFQ